MYILKRNILPERLARYIEERGAYETKKGFTTHNGDDIVWYVGREIGAEDYKIISRVFNVWQPIPGSNFYFISVVNLQPKDSAAPGSPMEKSGPLYSREWFPDGRVTEHYFHPSAIADNIPGVVSKEEAENALEKSWPIDPKLAIVYENQTKKPQQQSVFEEDERTPGDVAELQLFIATLKTGNFDSIIKDGTFQDAYFKRSAIHQIDKDENDEAFFVALLRNRGLEIEVYQLSDIVKVFHTKPRKSKKVPEYKDSKFAPKDLSFIEKANAELEERIRKMDNLLSWFSENDGLPKDAKWYVLQEDDVEYYYSHKFPDGTDCEGWFTAFLNTCGLVAEKRRVRYTDFYEYKITRIEPKTKSEGVENLIEKDIHAIVYKDQGSLQKFVANCGSGIYEKYISDKSFIPLYFDLKAVGEWDADDDEEVPYFRSAVEHAGLQYAKVTLKDGKTVLKVYLADAKASSDPVDPETSAYGAP